MVNLGQRYWPPLTPQLFDPNRLGYAEILAKYPLAKAAAAELGSAQSAVSIETQLRERYRDSEHEHDRRIFRGVLPYLQELLYTVSHEFTPFPQNYEILVTKLLRLKEVVFVSLNYDLLLDNALVTTDSDKSDMDWYIRTARRNWSLIKLHGSVDWGRELSSPRGDKDFTAPNANTPLSSKIWLRTGSLDAIRGFPFDSSVYASREQKLYFPALAAPVGESDELVCPPEHVRFLRDRLAESQPMHLLMVGYSGIDHEVVRLIRESERGIKTLTIVDQGKEAAWGVANRLAEQGVTSAKTPVFACDGFDTWVRDGGLDAFIGEMTDEPF